MNNKTDEKTLSLTVKTKYKPNPNPKTNPNPNLNLLNPNLGLRPRTPRQSSLHSLGGLIRSAKRLIRSAKASKSV